MESPLLVNSDLNGNKRNNWNNWIWVITIWLCIALVTILYDIGPALGEGDVSRQKQAQNKKSNAYVIESERGVVAADEGRCSEIGASILRSGGHAVDASVSTALCLGVTGPSSSGIGGGAFMLLWSSSNSNAQAYNMRETAPLASSQDMYDNNPGAKSSGALSAGVPGELAGLHAAWSHHGRLPWETLFRPAIKLAREGFVVHPLLGNRLAANRKKIMSDPGLRQVFAPNGRLLRIGDTCYNKELARTLELISKHGPKALYDGAVGEKLVKDIRVAGGILTMEDLRSYKVVVTGAMKADVMGHTILGMPPPSSGTLAISLILNMLESLGSGLKGSERILGLHRLVESLKHTLAVRMNLADPEFVDITKYVSEMLSKSFADQLRKKIFDNMTFPPEYYLDDTNRWSQLLDHGTSHFCIVDRERNAVSMTSTVNYEFGAGIISPSTGILLNNQMDDFSIPASLTPDKLSPAPSNFIEPKKHPLSSMTPMIIIKDGRFAGAIGGSGGLNIISAVAQVFLNHYIFGMEPLSAVQNSRVYHELIPNVVLYENWTMIDGNRVELPEKVKEFLMTRGHEVKACHGLAMCQLVAQRFQHPKSFNIIGRKNGKKFQSSKGILTAVSDPRKDGRPAAV